MTACTELAVTTGVLGLVVGIIFAAFLIHAGLALKAHDRDDT